MSDPIAEIETNIAQLENEIRDAMGAVREAEDSEKRLDQELTTAREALRLRSYELGKLLIRARGAWPQRGPNAKGWGEMLDRLGMTQPTAWRWMQFAGVVEVSSTGENVNETAMGTRIRDQEPDDRRSPPHADDEIPPDADVEIDRDTWCTPKWITEAIGVWDLDPCTNERSHVRTARAFDIELRGEDGLELAAGVKDTARVYINPPYSDVRPWIEAYAHTRFCFLLKVDPSTKWFARLLELAELVLVPRGTRVEFEPPAGVPPNKAAGVQFPHALFFARDKDATDAIRALCFPPWRIK